MSDKEDAKFVEIWVWTREPGATPWLFFALDGWYAEVDIDDIDKKWLYLIRNGLETRLPYDQVEKLYSFLSVPTGFTVT
jgi:hypothetical protein